MLLKRTAGVTNPFRAGPTMAPVAARRSAYDLGPQVMIECQPPYAGGGIAVNLTDGTRWVPVSGRGAPTVAYGNGVSATRFGFGDRTEARNGAWKNDEGRLAIVGGFTILAVAQIPTAASAPGAGGALIGTLSPTNVLTGLIVNKTTGFLEFWVAGTKIVQAATDYRDLTPHRFAAALNATANTATLYVDNVAVAQAVNVTARPSLASLDYAQALIGAAGITGGVPQNPLVADLRGLMVLCGFTVDAFADLRARVFAYGDSIYGNAAPDVGASDLVATLVPGAVS